MFIKKILFLPVITISLFIISCSESPTSTGTDLLRDDYIGVNQLDSFNDSLAQTSSYSKRVIQLGGSEKLLIGKSNNVEASTLLNFFVFLDDSILSDVREDKLQIISASVELTKTYTFGDSNAVLDFTVHRVNSRWSSATYTADSLSLIQYDQNDISTERNFSDSAVTFKIDNSLVLEWMKDGEDSAKHVDFGIFLKAAPSSQKIVGYQALSGATSSAQIPQLEVIYEKPGVYRDTLIFIPEADLSIVTGDLPNISNENIAIQSGLAVNSKLWFDLSGIPDNSVINYAELTLFLDTLETVTGSVYSNSLTAYAILDSSRMDSLSRGISLAGDKNDSSKSFTGNVTSIIQTIKNRKDNQGIMLRAGVETEGLELFVLKGSSAADRRLRPQLKIIYTNKQ